MDVRAGLAGLLDLVLPGRCAGCGRDGGCWCAACARGLGVPRLLVPGPGAPPTVAVGRYRGPLRAALLAYKEHGRRELAGPLARLLADAAWTRALDRFAAPGPVPARARNWWLVPVPSRSSAARARGGDHMRVLAELTAERLAARLAAAGGSVGTGPALRLERGVRDSVGLTPAARAANLRNGVNLIPNGLPPPGAELLLLDDVTTTGATLESCRNALTWAGRGVRGAIVLCDATGGSLNEDSYVQ